MWEEVKGTVSSSYAGRQGALREVRMEECGGAGAGLVGMGKEG